MSAVCCSDIEFEFHGSGLNRAECVLAHASGTLFAADWTEGGGVSVIGTNGAVGRVLAKSSVTDGPLRPNGICLEQNGTILAAHLGPQCGGVYRLHPDGTLEPVLTEIDGVAIPPSNFPVRDRRGWLWLTVSTRIQPRAADYRRSAASGFVVLQDARGARIVADGLGYTNEGALSADERHLFVNETFARRVVRFAVADDGSLRDKTVVATFGKGTCPDGIALDAAGGLWITSIVSNRVLRVDPEGRTQTVIEDADAAHLDWVGEAFDEGRMDREHLGKAVGRRLRNISSLAFGGPDLRTAYLGSLQGEAVASFRAPVAGLEPVHYHADIAPLLRAAGLAGCGPHHTGLSQ